MAKTWNNPSKDFKYVDPSIRRMQGERKAAARRAALDLKRAAAILDDSGSRIIADKNSPIADAFNRQQAEDYAKANKK